MKAGAYGLHTIPNENSWTVILNSETKAWGSYFYDKQKDVLRFNVTPKTTAHQEAMTFNFSQVSANKATVALSWSTTSIRFDINVNATDLINENIKSQLNSLPWWGWTGLYNAAQYNSNNNVHLDDAIKWVNRSIQNNRNFSNLNLKATILEKQGNTAEATKLRVESLILGTARDLQRVALSRFRAKDTKGGIKILKNVIINSPNNYQSYTVMAWGYEQIKDHKSAKKMYKKALKMAPLDKKEAIKEAMDKLK